MLYVEQPARHGSRASHRHLRQLRHAPGHLRRQQDQRGLAGRARAACWPATTARTTSRSWPTAPAGTSTISTPPGAGRRAPPSKQHRIATILGAAVFQAYKDLKPVAAGPLRAKSELVELALPEITPAQIEEAKQAIAATKDDRGGNFMKLVRAYRALDVAGREGKPHRVEVQVIALGRDVAWVSSAGRDLRRTGPGHQKAFAVPAHLPRRAGQREHRLHPRPPQLRRRQLRTRKRPLRRRFRRAARRGRRQAARGVARVNRRDSLRATATLNLLCLAEPLAAQAASEPAYQLGGYTRPGRLVTVTGALPHPSPLNKEKCRPERGMFLTSRQSDITGMLMKFIRLDYVCISFQSERSEASGRFPASCKPSTDMTS